MDKINQSNLKLEIFKDFLNLCDEETQIKIMKKIPHYLYLIDSPSEVVILTTIKRNDYL
jgi:hypothetical protein